MTLEILAEWLAVALALMFVAGTAGLGLARFLVLQERVERLEYWFGEVRWELLAQEQADEVRELRETVARLDYEFGMTQVPFVPVESGEVA